MCEKNTISSALADEFRVEGVNFMEYGIIPKFVMLDPDLTIEAKGIYAYFCSFAGAGNTAFPGRDKIVSDLGITKDTYYRHYNQLITSGYLTATERSAGGRGVGFRKNIYTLVSEPGKVLKALKDNPPSREDHPNISSTGIKAYGYGFIPKAVMTDPSLSIRAKSLYAFYCAFSGAGSSACFDIDSIVHFLVISKNSLSKYNRELLDAGYIQIQQKRTGGRLGVNEYFII